MRYTVDPGLYAMGNPDKDSPVLVTANYKMSFDRLREMLPARNVWILVLDTKGINVWCAAGKGTFGTKEVVDRIESSGLARVVSHRELILPQLSGPGVAAHEVRKLSGFKVIYGPIRSKDLPAFLGNGHKATPEMRQKTFNLWERAAVIPVELVAAFKNSLLIIPFFFIISFLGNSGVNQGLHACLALLISILSGAVLTPLLLPWLPGRAFSLKGLILGILAAFIFVALGPATGLERLAWLLIIPAASAFLAMNFTGASTYTSLSGVRKEMRWAVPFEIGAGVMGLGLWIGSNFIA
jgi:acetyl-CoA decarbonylase/synthase complex subunit gamma